MLLKIVDAKYICEHRISLTFNNGSTGIVDLKEKIFSDHRKIFEALQDESTFKEFKLNRWTIQWKNGLDLAPEFLYELMSSQKEKLPQTS